MSYISELRKYIGHKPLMSAASMCILYDKEKGILLEKRSDNGLWCTPGGGLELGEDQEAGLRREVKEETNLDIDNPQLFTVRANVHMVYPNQDEVYYTDIVYLVTEYSGELKPDKESVELRWFDLEHLPEIMATQIDYIRMFKEKIEKENVIEYREEQDIIRLFTTEKVKEYRTLYSGHGDDDFREAIFVTLANGERFVIKVAANWTTPEHIRMWQRCAQEYIDLGYFCPRILASLAGDFPAVEYKGHSCFAFAEEYAKYKTAEHIKNRRYLWDEMYKMTARVAAKKFDYTDIPSAYALYTPVDPGGEVDEVTENALYFQEYCKRLPERFKEQTDRMFRRWEENYNNLKETYYDLPFSVFQADFGETNVLVDEDGAFVGVLDFNCAGRDNFLNYVFREINAQTLEQTADEILRALRIASEYYTFSEAEIEAAPMIFRCVKPLWYCSVSDLEDAGEDLEAVQKILDSMEYAQTREIDFRSVMRG